MTYKKILNINKLSTHNWINSKYEHKWKPAIDYSKSDKEIFVRTHFVKLHKLISPEVFFLQNPKGKEDEFKKKNPEKRLKCLYTMSIIDRRLLKAYALHKKSADPT